MGILKRLKQGDLRIEDRGAAVYLWSAFAPYAVRALVPTRIRRDSKQIHDEYNHERGEYWKPDLSFDEYVYGDKIAERWIILDGQMVRGTSLDVRGRVLPLLRARVEKYSKPGDLIVEFGSGTGRNLAYLARALPDRRYLGLELTPRTVEDSRKMLAKFDLAVDVRVADMTKPLEPPVRAAVAYSFLALEQLPAGLSRLALEQMSRTATEAIVCIEPIRELYPATTLRGLTSHLRQRRADYLEGLPGYAVDLGLKVVTKERLGVAEHPFNEMCELLVELH